MSKKGFTLIELLVVVAVLALLASIVFSNLGGAREGARISNALSFQSQTHSLLGSDLIGWWSFNDPDDRYKDISGYDYNGSCTSCPIPADGVPGRGGTAMEFDGVDNRININPSYNVSQLSVSAWIKGGENIHSPYSRIVNHWTPGFIMAVTSGDRFRVYLWDDGEDSLTGVSNLDDGNWNHIFFTVDTTDGLFKIYVNGEEENSKNSTITSNINMMGTLFIGGNTSRFKGIIDDVRIYSRALTTSEVQILYAQTKDKYLANE